MLSHLAVLVGGGNSDAFNLKLPLASLGASEDRRRALWENAHSVTVNKLIDAAYVTKPIASSLYSAPPASWFTEASASAVKLRESPCCSSYPCMPEVPFQTKHDADRPQAMQLIIVMEARSEFPDYSSSWHSKPTKTATCAESLRCRPRCDKARLASLSPTTGNPCLAQKLSTLCSCPGSMS